MQGKWFCLRGVFAFKFTHLIFKRNSPFQFSLFVAYLRYENTCENNRLSVQFYWFPMSFHRFSIWRLSYNINSSQSQHELQNLISRIWPSDWFISHTPLSLHSWQMIAIITMVQVRKSISWGTQHTMYSNTASTEVILEYLLVNWNRTLLYMQ